MHSIARLFATVLCFAARGGVAQLKDSSLKIVESSPFHMILSPVTNEMHPEQAVMLEAAIKNSLYSSTLSNPTMQSVLDMDVVLIDMEWNEVQDNIDQGSVEVPSMVIKFITLATFFIVDSNVASLPSRYALDRAVVQTYSQISSKSNFIGMLHRLGDPLFENIVQITIGSINGNLSNDDTQNGKDLRGFSILEIFLILASILILGGIINIIFQYYKDRAPFGNEQFLSLNVWNETDTESHIETCDLPTTRPQPIEGPNEAAAINSTNLLVATDSPESPTRLSHDTDSMPTVSLSDLASSFLSWSSPSSNNSSSMFTSESVAIPNLDGSLATSSSPICPHVLLHPSSEDTAYLSRLTVGKGNPIILSLSNVQDEVESISTDASLVAVDYDSSDAMEASSMSNSPTELYATPDMKEFGANWLELKAETDNEELDNKNDVFRIDMSASPGTAGNESVSTDSSISEWMKTVRVVHSSSVTGASTMTISSIEESTVESFSSNSDSCAMGHSLADSGAEI